MSRHERRREKQVKSKKSTPSSPATFDPQAVFRKALGLQQAGELVAAEVEYRKILDVFPNHAGLNANFALVLRGLGKLDEALECCRAAICVDPVMAEAYATLGAVEIDLENFEAALTHLDKALEINPNLGAAAQNRALALLSLGRERQLAGDGGAAIQAFQNLLSEMPNHPDARNNLAVALAERGQPGVALYEIDAVLAHRPEFSEAHLNRGNILRDLGQNEDAVRAYQRSLEIDKSSVDAHLNLALALLCREDFEAGWREFEWRWKTENMLPFLRKFAIPEWRGEELSGQKLLIWSEQGLGDEVLFSLLLPDVVQRLGPGNVIFECEARLAGLYQRTFPEIVVLAREKTDICGERVPYPHFDFHIPAGNLPRFFRPHTEDFPGTITSLRPDQKKVSLWAERLAALGAGLKVGIAWKGGMLGQMKKRKSVDLNVFKAFLDQGGVHFINLQYGDCSSDLARARDFGALIHDWPDADPLLDLETQAAQIANLDLVIQTSNASVHLAGALGVPVWNLVSFAADWRWGQKKETSLWYPSMRIYRQDSEGDWQSVSRKVAKDLGRMVDNA